MNLIQDCGRYFLYRHIRNDTGLPFYIGIGTKGKDKTTYVEMYKRAFIKSNRSTYWKAIVAKTTYKIEILLESDSPVFIKEKEKEFIKLYGRVDQQGLLCNFTDGGDGAWGHQVSDSHRQLLRNLKRFSQDKALAIMKDIHKEKYDYSSFIYINAHTKGSIKCPTHGEFLQTFAIHVYNKSGCPKCADLIRHAPENYIKRKLKASTKSI